MRTGILRIIAGKELRDQIRSKRFRTLFAILLIIAVAGLIDGAFSYQESLENYNEMLVAASEGETDLSYNYYEGKPSVLEAFNRIGYLLSTVAAVLGIAMGFDLITAEKESKSLKILLSHPIYRDEVITGKALGGAGAIALAMAIVIVLAVAVLLIFGVVPSFEETVRVLIFGGLSFLMVFSFFILALFFSTAAKDSGSALVLTLVLFVTLSAVTMLVISGPAITFLIGDPPEPPGSSYSYSFSTGPNSITSVSSSVSGDSSQEFDQEEYQEKMEEYRQESNAYWERRMAITDTFTLLSPDQNYQRLAFAVTEPGLEAARQHQGENAPIDLMTEPRDGLSTFFGLLGGLSQRIIALFVFPAAFFGLAWVKFAREDIR